jgi:hypothetical protein
VESLGGTVKAAEKARRLGPFVNTKRLILADFGGDSPAA